MKYESYDVVIIGGGVIGCAVARELSAYKLRTLLLEKEEDVCSGTSKANSAIVHAGYDALSNTQKARFNVAGNKMMEEWSRELDFDFKRNGSMVLCFHEEELGGLDILYQRGIQNGVPDLKIITGDQARELEPNLSDEVVGALWIPTGGIVCPFGLTIALAENAYDNGVEFQFNTTVEHIERTELGYRLTTSKGEVNTANVVNAAGVYSDVFHNMVSGKKLKITARSGEYCLLDKEAGNHISHTVFQLPGKLGKGILVTPTVHGNLLIGPTVLEVDERDETKTTKTGLEYVIKTSAQSVKNIPYRQTITSFSGIRAHEEGDDFIIGEPEDAKGFYDAAGIESPGLSCAPAIGRHVAELVADRTQAERNPDFNPKRTGIIRPERLSIEERATLIKENPSYGTIVCRCENISEGEIIDAVRRPLGAVSLDGVKRRVRAGMGRCQAGFCTPKTMEIISREAKIPMEEICKNNQQSNMLAGRK